MTPTPSSEQEPSLRDYLDVIRRRKLVLLLVITVVVGVALAHSLTQTPVYASSAEVLLRTKAAEGIFNNESVQWTDPERALQTEMRILKSRPVAEMVRAKLGYPASVVTSSAGQTDVILITGESPEPRRAADIANAYASSYLDFKRKQTVDDLLAAAKEVQIQIDDLARQISAAPATDSGRNALLQQQAVFQGQLDGLQVSAAIRTGGAQLVSEAEVSTVPVRPKPVRTGVLALVLGIFLGVGLVFLFDFLDDTIKTKADFERAANSLSVLGLIPGVGTWKDEKEARLVSVTEPSSHTAEAYRTLRTSVQFLSMDRPVQVVQMTSPSASEGKTTTLANLAVAMARAGLRVVVVCCDLRRPRVHEYFGLSNQVGFTSVLLGEVGLSHALQRVPDVERLYVLASGPLPPNPSELLSSRRATEVLRALRSEGGVLLVDCPPVLPVTDALVLSKHVDATLLVIRVGDTTRKDVGRAVEILDQVKAPLAGAILNGVGPEGTYGYRYAYGYYQADLSVNGNAHGATRDRKRRRKKAGRSKV